MPNNTISNLCLKCCCPLLVKPSTSRHQNCTMCKSLLPDFLKNSLQNILVAREKRKTINQILVFIGDVEIKPWNEWGKDQNAKRKTTPDEPKKGSIKMKLAHITQLRVSVWLLLQLVLLMFSTYCKSQCIKGAKAKVRIRAKFSILYECQCQSDVTAYNQNITISVWLQTKCCSGLVLLLLRKRERDTADELHF